MKKVVRECSDLSQWLESTGRGDAYRKNLKDRPAGVTEAKADDESRPRKNSNRRKVNRQRQEGRRR